MVPLKAWGVLFALRATPVGVAGGYDSCPLGLRTSSGPATAPPYLAVPHEALT